MNRRNQSGSNRNRSNAPRGPSRANPARGAARGPVVPKPVSPNYQVDMMHHRVGANQQQTAQPSYHGGGRYQPQARPDRPDRPHQRPQKSSNRHPYKKASTHSPQPSPSSSRSGYTMVNLEIKEELYRKFSDKLKSSSKTPKEVINQLISFYNMDKINI